MVPLQAGSELVSLVGSERNVKKQRTEFLLDDLENFLLVEFLWKTLHSGQSLATITLCRSD